MKISEYMAEIGRVGGKKTSKRKKKSGQANMKKAREALRKARSDKLHKGK